MNMHSTPRPRDTRRIHPMQPPKYNGAAEHERQEMPIEVVVMYLCATVAAACLVIGFICGAWAQALIG